MGLYCLKAGEPSRRQFTPLNAVLWVMKVLFYLTSFGENQSLIALQCIRQGKMRQRHGDPAWKSQSNYSGLMTTLLPLHVFSLITLQLGSGLEIRLLLLHHPGYEISGQTTICSKIISGNDTTHWLKNLRNHHQKMQYFL